MIIPPMKWEWSTDDDFNPISGGWESHEGVKGAIKSRAAALQTGG
jgi:hypothetical protein